ncbi:hypothetical protein CCR75_006129 [Bremia lactucae]|uniref:Prolyl aminopeptidase n=1 Tax=Bremia lactucae TaxID=4779 RepID=A0A976NZE6_BRELC|nr:hypothetical protein CCR75_006129 [Bremia lactucae]
MIFNGLSQAFNEYRSESSDPSGAGMDNKGKTHGMVDGGRTHCGNVENQYFVQKVFFPTDNFLNQNIIRIRHISTVIVQGRYDVVCPMQTAWDFLSGSDYRIVQTVGIRPWSLALPKRELIQPTNLKSSSMFGTETRGTSGTSIIPFHRATITTPVKEAHATAALRPFRTIDSTTALAASMFLAQSRFTTATSSTSCC